MANTQAGSVIRVDASAQFDGSYEIKSIKYIGATSGSVTIKEGSSSGSTVWEESGTANVYNAEMCMNLRNGFYVTIVAGTPAVYLYLE